MHVAICDDNVADRKHLERLLSREADLRVATPMVLFIESFGNKFQFLRNPLKYDILFMDMVSEPNLAKEIIDELVRLKFTAPIILFSSTVDYTKIDNLPDNVVHMNKPYVRGYLSDLLELGYQHEQGTILGITVHKDNEAIFIPKDKILYCIPHKDKIHYEIHQTDESITICDEKAIDLQLLCERYFEMIRINRRVIINMNFTTMITPISIMMQDHKVFYYNPIRYNEMTYKKTKAGVLS